MSKIVLSGAVAVIAAASSMFAGGFWVQLDTPAMDSEARAKGVVLVARVSGCHDYSKAVVTATAEGIQDGHRQSLPLTLIPLSGKGSYGLAKTWPSEGTWAVVIVARENGATTSSLAKMEPRFNKEAVKYFPRTPTSEEIESMIRMPMASASR